MIPIMVSKKTHHAKQFIVLVLEERGEKRESAKAGKQHSYPRRLEFFQTMVGMLTPTE